MSTSDIVKETVKNPVLRNMALDSINKTRGDFGLVIEGGVDLEQFAASILQECYQHLTNIGQDYAREQLEKRWEENGTLR